MASVLIIEDEAPLSRMMAVFLLDAGFEVATAQSVVQALEKITTYQPDLIVFNTIIGDARKRQAIDQLRAGCPASKVLDVSIEKNRLMRGIVEGHASDGASRDGATPSAHLDGASPDGGTPAAQSGPGNADAVLSLPFEASILVDALHKLLAQKPAKTPKS